MAYYIYKISNTINAKLYIGCTTTTIESRWREHLSKACGKPREWTCSAIYGAIRELGPDKFSIEQVEECPENIPIMLDRERHWIRHHASQAPNGYNLSVRKLTDEQAAIIRFNAYKITLKEYAALFKVSIGTAQIARTGRGSYFTSDPYSHLTRDHLPDRYR